MTFSNQIKEILFRTLKNSYQATIKFWHHSCEQQHKDINKIEQLDLELHPIA
jgi:hypothetical protein